MSTNLVPTDPEPADDSYLRFPELKARVGLSRSTIHRMVRAGAFPSPKRLGVRAVGWLSSDIARWRKDRPDARGQAVA
jgi:prophage regulatory protein